MIRKIISVALLGTGIATAVVPSAGMAQYYGSGRDRNTYYDNQYRDQQGYDRSGSYSHNGYRNARAYRGHDRYYRQRCGGGNGAVGTVAGGAGGALIGNAVGGGTVGTVLGGVGGALLGRHLDKQHTRDREGC